MSTHFPVHLGGLTSWTNRRSPWGPQTFGKKTPIFILPWRASTLVADHPCDNVTSLRGLRVRSSTSSEISASGYISKSKRSSTMLLTTLCLTVSSILPASWATCQDATSLVCGRFFPSPLCSTSVKAFGAKLRFAQAGAVLSETVRAGFVQPHGQTMNRTVDRRSFAPDSVSSKVGKRGELAGRPRKIAMGHETME